MKTAKEVYSGDSARACENQEYTSCVETGAVPTEVSLCRAHLNPREVAALRVELSFLKCSKQSRSHSYLDFDEVTGS
jgi:hypothetical protein